MFRFVALFALVAAASALPRGFNDILPHVVRNPFTVDTVTYPCGQSEITDACVAAYLTLAAGCEAPTTEITGVLSRAFTIEAPFFEATIHRYESYFSGIADAYVSSFYTDSAAGKTVMSVTFPAVTNSGHELIQYHDVTDVDTEVNTSFSIDYTGIIVTAQWEGVESITIGTARVYSEIESTTYDLETGFPELAAEIANNPEGAAATTATLVSENRDVYAREEVLYVGRAVARLWWNNNVCANLP